MGPVAELLFGDNDDVDGNAERANQVPQSNHLSPRIGESALDDEQIQIRVIARVAPGAEGTRPFFRPKGREGKACVSAGSAQSGGARTCLKA